MKKRRALLVNFFSYIHISAEFVCLAEWAFTADLHEKHVTPRTRVEARGWRRWFHWLNGIHLLQLSGECSLNLCFSIYQGNAVGEGSATTSLYCITCTHGVEVTAEPLAPPVISVSLDILHPILARRVSWVTVISLVVLKTGVGKTVLPPLLMLVLNRAELLPYLTLCLTIFLLLAVVVHD